MSDPSSRSHVDGASIKADVILLSGMSREDWLAQLDQALAGGCDLSDLSS